MSENKVAAKPTPLPAAKKRVAAPRPTARKVPGAKPVAASKPAAAPRVAEKKPLVAVTQATKIKKPKKADSKVKVVRDSFAMPQSDYAKIGELKALCLKSGMKVKKSELLRAGLHALGKLTASQLKQALSGVEAIKTGHPKKH